MYHVWRYYYVDGILGKMNYIIVVARNNIALTKQAVRAALAQDIPVEIIIVDNVSSDGTYFWARAVEFQKPNVRLIRLSVQRSLAECWNLGLKMVWDNGGTHALVLNNDVVIHPATYRTLEEHGGLFVTTVSVDNEEQFHFDDLPYKFDDGGEAYIPDRPHPNFSGFLIRKECWDRVGPFNKEYYPAYCEDAEYHVRMYRAGIRAVCIDLPMLHLGNGANTLRFADPTEQAMIHRGADANRKRFRETYGCVPGESEYEALFTEDQSVEDISAAHHPASSPDTPAE